VHHHGAAANSSEPGLSLREDGSPVAASSAAGKHGRESTK
jgi:hypothetical protein